MKIGTLLIKKNIYFCIYIKEKCKILYKNIEIYIKVI